MANHLHLIRYTQGFGILQYRVFSVATLVDKEGMSGPPRESFKSKGARASKEIEHPCAIYSSLERVKQSLPKL
jgi:hypothetical protein